MSPRKVRLVADLIRGRSVMRAETLLTVLRKRAASPLRKLLQSAAANARNNFNLDPNTLRVGRITVDGGPVLKRFMPKAHGRATPVRERTCHISLTLEERRVSKKLTSIATDSVDIEKIKDQNAK